MRNYGYGVDVGGTSVKIGYFDDDGKLIDKWEIATRRENNGSKILPDIAAAIKEHMKKNDVGTDTVAGIGIGVPGPVDKDGVVNKCVNLGWDVTDVAGIMQSLTGLRIKVANDANIAALGEMWQGGGHGYKNIIFVTLGTGVGGGIIIDGKVVGGAHGAGGEIGHIPVNLEEKEFCGCGKRGCLEQYASATGIVKKADKMLRDDSAVSSLRKLKNITSKDIWTLAEQGDPVCKETIAFFGTMLAQGLSAIACVCDPEIFVIGGGTSKAGQSVIDAVSLQYRKLAFHASANTGFVIAKLGNDAGIYGGAYEIFSTYN